jgi:hypothetical protein
MKVLTLKMNGRVYTEEVPTNSASSGAIAGLPPDEPPVRKRKRKSKFKTDIFQRIRNARLKEETMEDQTIIAEADNQSTEVSAAMRMIQTKRKLAKKQEREKRATNRKSEIAAMSKAKAKDYQKKAGERQKNIAKDVSKASSDNKKNESFDWQAAFTELNEQFASLTQEQQEKFLRTWLQMSEETQDKFGEMIEENFDRANQFVENL